MALPRFGVAGHFLGGEQGRRASRRSSLSVEAAQNYEIRTWLVSRDEKTRRLAPPYWKPKATGENARFTEDP